MSRDGQAPRGAVPLPLACDLKRLVWLALLPLAGVMGADSIRRVQAAEDRLVHQAAEQLAGDVDELLRRHLLAQQLMAASPLHDGPDLADFHRSAQAVREQLGSVLILDDTTGRMLVHFGVPLGQPLPVLPAPRPGAHAAAPQALASGRPAVGDVVIGPVVQPAALGQDSVLRRAALALAAAIGAATVAGVVAGSVGGARLSAAVTALASPADGAAVPLRIREIDSARAALQDMAAERQRTLHVLQEVHERFATVFDSAPVAMAVGPGRCRMPASPR